MNKKQLREAWEIRKAVCDALGIEMCETKSADYGRIIKFDCEMSANRINYMLGIDAGRYEHNFEDLCDQFFDDVRFRDNKFVYLKIAAVIRHKCPTCEGHGAIADENSNRDMDNGLFDRDSPCPNDDCDDGFIYTEET